MSKIGFQTDGPGDASRTADASEVLSGRREVPAPSRRGDPVRSVVQVHFPDQGRTLAYYNDRFDLRVGDIVYVEGKLEGARGRVVQVSRSFKIRLSDYKRVTGVADTRVRGQFWLAGPCLLTFSPSVLPYEQVSTWFRGDAPDEEEYVTGDGTEGFALEGPWELDVGREIAERGQRYYREDRVAYLCLDHGSGRAIVEGTRAYEVAFDCDPSDGTVRGIVCDCPCFYPCKHEVAVLLQLQEILSAVEERYGARYEETGYVAAVSRKAFFTFAGNGAVHGSLLWDPDDDLP